jgi:hypothetical protein
MIIDDGQGRGPSRAYGVRDENLAPEGSDGLTMLTEEFRSSASAAIGIDADDLAALRRTCGPR